MPAQINPKVNRYRRFNGLRVERAKIRDVKEAEWMKGQFLNEISRALLKNDERETPSRFIHVFEIMMKPRTFVPFHTHRNDVRLLHLVPERDTVELWAAGEGEVPSKLGTFSSTFRQEMDFNGGTYYALVNSSQTKQTITCICFYDNPNQIIEDIWLESSPPEGTIIGVV
ncbi:MAG: hypothetical protein K9M11_04315 [Candidatus Pacebacteria bacterium]|nr:hypothetical protein [Candidatus Paceibacterota bacterium]